MMKQSATVHANQPDAMSSHDLLAKTLERSAARRAAQKASAPKSVWQRLDNRGPGVLRPNPKTATAWNSNNPNANHKIRVYRTIRPLNIHRKNDLGCYLSLGI